MSAPAPPVVPARPSRTSRSPSKEAQQALETPAVPARPPRKSAEQHRPASRDRFAQSPLHSGFTPKTERPTSSSYGLAPASDPIERPGSVSLPSLGEEGREYGALEQPVDAGITPAEQTRTVDHSLKLHAPTPSLPSATAKQQIQAVTRTDSDKGSTPSTSKPERPPSRDPLVHRPSSTFSAHSDHNHTDDEHGIPRIGQRVPMSSHLGDVQAPSPAPDEGKKHHNRKHSARNLPPGSYGLHGHGVESHDKLEKAYLEKHPELKGKEKHHHVHDHRQSDFARSSNDLNRMVRDTAKRPTSGLFNEAVSTPTEDVAYHATDEYAYRISTPQFSSKAEKTGSYFPSDASTSKAAEEEKSAVLHAIHVDDSNHPEHYSYGEEHQNNAEEYNAPILAGDEIDAGPDTTAQHPAIRPGFDRSRSYDAEERKKPSIRHPVAAHDSHPERDFTSTPLEDVEEYEPLFDEEKKEEAKQAAAEKRASRHFPSKDIWEDAPNSVHYSTEVSTPDVEEQNQRPRSKAAFSEGRSITPAQAFAQYQEELAEKEAAGRSNSFLPLSAEPSKPKWIDHQSHLGLSRPPSARRFPSKDIWEDAPESHIQEATLSESAPEEDEKTVEESQPEVPARPAKKETEEPKAVPAIPSRPKPKQVAGEEAARQPPPISDKPKPSIPARPVKKLSGDAKDGEAVKPPKPPVPSRPVGGKIAALQAGFMSDLNKRLQLGPQALKKDEPAEEEAAEPKEKAPLSDARKGRARGPQRRAPAKAASPVKEPTTAVSVLSISAPQTLWSIDPENGNVTAHDPHEHTKDLSRTTGEEHSIEASVLTKEDKESDSSTAKEPAEKPEDSSEEPATEAVHEPAKEHSHQAGEDGTALHKANVVTDTNPAEPKTAKQGSEAEKDEPVDEPAVRVVEEASGDIANAKLPAADVEKKAEPVVSEHESKVESSKQEKDIGDVPLAEAETGEAA